MDTLQILLYGAGALIAIVVLRFLFSKRNDSKKEMSPPIELKDKASAKEEDDRDDYSGSGFSLPSLIMSIVILVFVITMGGIILIAVWDATNSTTTFNQTNEATETFAIFGDWFGIVVIVGVAAIILSIIFMTFGSISIMEEE